MHAQKILLIAAIGAGSSLASAGLPWDWGEQYYDSNTSVPLQVTNDCKVPVPVKFKKKDLPWLSYPSDVVVPPTSKTVVQMPVKIGPPPPPPLRLGLPGEPGWGWVEPPRIVPPPGQFPVPQFHQPNFGKISGSLDVSTPEVRVRDYVCYASVTSWSAKGHIHFRPPTPDPGPSRLAETDPCQVWWNTDEQPPAATERKCVYKIRGLARGFVERALAYYIQNDPDRWLWLSAIEINSASIGELLAMKDRAGRQLSNSDALTSEYSAPQPGTPTSSSALRQVGAPVTVAAPDGDCGRVWESPQMLDKKRSGACRDALANTAVQWRRKMAPQIKAAPDAWRWLPSVDALQQMGANELLGIKAKADEIWERSP